MIPILVNSDEPCLEKTMVKKWFRMTEPFFLTRSNSAVFVRKNERFFPNYHSSETVKRYRPFFRRRAKTFRPFLVLIRFRNPWSRFLFRFDGCRYVIDTEQYLLSRIFVGTHHFMGRASKSQTEFPGNSISWFGNPWGIFVDWWDLERYSRSRFSWFLCCYASFY